MQCRLSDFYVDWSHGKVDVLVRETTEHRVFHNLTSMLEWIDSDFAQGQKIALESTFESFFRETERNSFIDRVSTSGHELVTIPTRATGRWKLRVYPPEEYPKYYGNNAKFPDDLAVDLFRKMDEAGVHFSVPRKFDPNDPKINHRQEANDVIMLLRNSKRVFIGPRGGRNVVSYKDDYADTLIGVLPPYDHLSDHQKVALGNGKEYSKVIVAAVGVATAHSQSRQDFDRVSGMYHHGYPSQIRSDLHLHGWWKTAKGKTPKREMIGIKEYRKAIRWMYHHLKVTKEVLEFPI